MLPGFRFLFTAIVLSMSILIFGLGAAALLRAAHEEFANLPARRAPPQPMFARQNDDQPPNPARSWRRFYRPLTAKANSTLPGKPFRCADPDVANTIPPATTGPPTSSAPPCPGRPFTVLNSRMVS